VSCTNLPQPRIHLVPAYNIAAGHSEAQKKSAAIRLALKSTPPTLNPSGRVSPHENFYPIYFWRSLLGTAPGPADREFGERDGCGCPTCTDDDVGGLGTHLAHPATKQSSKQRKTTVSVYSIHSAPLPLHHTHPPPVTVPILRVQGTSGNTDLEV